MANQRLTDIPNVPGALESLSSKHMQKRILGVVANNNTKRCVADRYTEIQENDQGIHELRDCGMSTHELRDCGMSTHELRDCGMSTHELRNCGMSTHEFRDCGMSTQELRDCGMSTHELRDSGKSTHEIHNGTLFLARHPTTLKWTQTRGASFTSRRREH